MGSFLFVFYSFCCVVFWFFFFKQLVHMELDNASAEKALKFNCVSVNCCETVGLCTDCKNTLCSNTVKLLIHLWLEVIDLWLFLKRYLFISANVMRILSNSSISRTYGYCLFLWKILIILCPLLLHVHNGVQLPSIFVTEVVGIYRIWFVDFIIHPQQAECFSKK